MEPNIDYSELQIKLIKAEREYSIATIQFKAKSRYLYSLQSIISVLHAQRKIADLLEHLIHESLNMNIEKALFLTEKKHVLQITNCAGYSRREKAEILNKKIKIEPELLFDIKELEKSEYIQDKNHILLKEVGLIEGVIVPIKAEDNKLLGVFLGGYSEKKIGFFSAIEKDDLVFFSLMGSQASLALQNLNYSLKLKDWNVQLEREVQDRTAELEETTSVLAQQKKELLKLNEEITSANELKSRFFSNMSHELRTPIHVIRGTNDFLLKKERIQQDTETLSLLAMVNKSAERLLNLVNDILDLSKLESGKIEIVEEAVCFEEVISGLHQTMQMLLEDKTVEFIADNTIDLDMIIRTDKRKVGQVILNVLSNAAKFTSKGSITLRTYLQDKRVYFQVIDTGAGLSPEEVLKIFDSFYQAKTSRNPNIKGTGLGLAICKKYLELLGGDITAESELKKGTRFTFWVPFVRGEFVQVKQVVYQNEIDNELIRNKQIMLVDDDEFNRKFVDIILKNRIHYDLADGGLAAIALALEKKYDLILLDIEMPTMNGKKVLRFIRQHEINQDTPIVAVTAQSMKGDRESFLEFGFNNYLSKPFNQDELLELITYMIKQHS